MDVLAVLLSIFTLSILAPALHRFAGNASGVLSSLLPFSLVFYFATLLPRIAAGTPLSASYPWVPGLGLRLSFYVDGWSLLFALLISGVGGIVLIYSGSYLRGHPELGRFYSYLLLFMGSMLGLVVSDNLLLVFVFWELTGFASYMLIGFEHERDRARAGALQALLVTGAGGLALLAGFVLLGQVTGSYEYSEFLSAAGSVRAHPLYPAVLALALAGAFTKSAQFPFHFWLPNAMEAPTPVSAYLHSATMVKAGIYLLGRLNPVLGGTLLWSESLTVVGGVTMLSAAWLGLGQSDLKRILAYSTVSALGLMTFLLGVGTPEALAGAAVFLFGHALYKGALFLIAGVVDHETGTRDVSRLGGLRQAMPITAAAAALAAFSMAGLPPFLGYLGKESVYAALSDGEPLLLVAAALTSALFFALAAIVVVQPFFSGRLLAPGKPREGPTALWSGPLVLSGAGLLLGLAPDLVDESLLASASRAIAGKPVDVDLVLWHGFTPAFFLSLVTFAGGIAVFASRRRWSLQPRWIRVIERWGPERWYEGGLEALYATASTQTRLLQNGYLRYYLLTVVAATLTAVGAPLLRSAPLSLNPAWSDFRFYELALAALVMSAALATASLDSRWGAVAALGVVGYGLALIFILFGAPDLAMTQFLFETLMVILFVLVFYFLPRFATSSPPGARLRDAVVALLAGGLMTLLVMIATEVQLQPSISGYFAEGSVPKAHGRNIVNVILVDFRALDTLGEITVLAAAGIGVFALLKLGRGEGIS
ncbi:MAG TPA: putative monovalent cation/H+ antiporter subunit A [candidate division Zixibacteria bacterium]|nr:putative monovalent cation/H+ antiporter subunit A [candidate division Zixibacteria bacterium]